jgi:hypothetical protein
MIFPARRLSTENATEIGRKAMKEYDKKQVVDLLNRILESELAGVIRYTHYSFLVYQPVAEVAF